MASEIAILFRRICSLYRWICCSHIHITYTHGIRIIKEYSYIPKQGLMRACERPEKGEATILELIKSCIEVKYGGLSCILIPDNVHRSVLIKLFEVHSSSGPRPLSHLPCSKGPMCPITWTTSASYSQHFSPPA